MTRPTRAHFFSELVDGVIIVEDDNDGAMSVTNDIEAVARALSARYERPHGPMIYRDSLGNWDGVAIEGGEYRAFIPFNVRTRDEALIGIALHNAAQLCALMIAEKMAPACFAISGLEAAREAFTRIGAANTVCEP